MRNQVRTITIITIIHRAAVCQRGNYYVSSVSAAPGAPLTRARNGIAFNFFFIIMDAAGRGSERSVEYDHSHITPRPTPMGSQSFLGAGGRVPADTE